MTNKLNTLLLTTIKKPRLDAVMQEKKVLCSAFRLVRILIKCYYLPSLCCNNNFIASIKGSRHKAKSPVHVVCNVITQNIPQMELKREGRKCCGYQLQLLDLGAFGQLWHQGIFVSGL